MNFKVHPSKHEKGFSLVEMMVVVALIGILAAIGIPQYRKFRMKSFQVEAKSHLASIYTAEISFFAEYSGYHHSLKVLGYGPAGNNRYNAGFGATGTIPADAPIEDSVLNTYSICSGPYGGGSDPNCSIVINVPPINFSRTWVTANTFSAQATAYESGLEQASYVPTNPVYRYVFENFFSAESAVASPVSIPMSTAVYMESWTIDQNKQLNLGRDSLVGI